MSDYDHHKHSSVGRYVTIGLVALFPGFRTFIGLFGLILFVAAVVVLTFLGDHGPAATQQQIYMQLLGVMLVLASVVVLFGIWLPAVVLAWLAPKVVDRITDVADDYFDEPEPPVRRRRPRAIS